MDWLDRIRRRGEPDREDDRGAPGPEPGGRSHATPGVATVFEGLLPDGGHVLLDVGMAAPSHLRLFRPYARRIRFAGLLPAPPGGHSGAATLRELRAHPSTPYDIVLLWDLLDRIPPSGRGPVLDRLSEITAEGARLYAAVAGSGESTTRPTRWVLESLDRVRREPTGSTEPARPALLPAEVERLLHPSFEVTRAFTLRTGVREYVAVRGRRG